MAAETLANLQTKTAKDALQGYLKSEISSLERQRIERAMAEPVNYQLNATSSTKQSLCGNE